jgi:hypothetical protein
MHPMQNRLTPPAPRKHGEQDAVQQICNSFALSRLVPCSIDGFFNKRRALRYK